MSRLGARSSVVAGLLAGITAAVVLIAGVVAFAPEPVAPSPTPVLPSASAPSPSTAASPVAPTSVLTPSPEPTASEGSLFHVGEPAPALVVPQVGGGSIDLAALRGKPVWVNFMATWCPPCQDEFPLMNGYAARMPMTAW